MSPSRMQTQRGGASLVVVMVLLCSMALVVAYANRSLLFEQRSSINQYRATQAFEAAEAGLEWAQAMLNNPQRVDDDCQSAPGGSSMRQRWLNHDAARQRHVPVAWSDAGRITPRHAACARTASGWSCRCPADAHPTLAAATVASATTAFIVHAEPVDDTGMVRLVATGCSGVAGACAPAGSTTVEAVATVQAVFALVPGIASLPTAPLTVRGEVHAGAAAIGLHNGDAASAGIVLHAGGPVLASHARITTVPGGSSPLALVAHDDLLAGLSGEQLFASLFGLDKASWAAQPAVRRVVCGGDCGAALTAAVSAAAGPALLFVDGDLAVNGPLTLGTPADPVILVSTGRADLRGELRLHGVLYAADLAWQHTPASGAWLRGAFVSESDYRGDATPDLVYDAPVLRALQQDSGSFVRVPGSWRDFQ